MPSPIYYLELDNKTVGSLDVSTSVVTGLQFGNTELRLKGQSILFSFHEKVFCY